MNFTSWKISIHYPSKTGDTVIIKKRKQISYFPKAVNNKHFQTTSLVFIPPQLYFVKFRKFKSTCFHLPVCSPWVILMNSVSSEKCENPLCHLKRSSCLQGFHSWTTLSPCCKGLLSLCFHRIHPLSSQLLHVTQTFESLDCHVLIVRQEK